MKFIILIQSLPEQALAKTALRFCEAAIKNHELSCVFFHQAGVYHANANAEEVPEDEFNIFQCWKDLSDKYDIKLLCCSGALARRGIKNINSHFEVAGLGQFMASLNSDCKLIQF